MSDITVYLKNKSDANAIIIKISVKDQRDGTDGMQEMIKYKHVC